MTLDTTGVGFGSILEHGVGIVAMGNHFLPLGELDRFGFVKSSSCARMQFPAWVRLCDPFEKGLPGSIWSEFDYSQTGKKIILSNRLENFGPDATVFCAFFLKGEHLCIAEEPKKFGLFERYQGENLPISLGDNAFEIRAQFSGAMQLIPLAGDESFWGANYLLAFQLPDDGKLYRWHIIFTA